MSSVPNLGGAVLKEETPRWRHVEKPLDPAYAEENVSSEALMTGKLGSRRR